MLWSDFFGALLYQPAAKGSLLEEDFRLLNPPFEVIGEEKALTAEEMQTFITYIINLEKTQGMQASPAV